MNEVPVACLIVYKNKIISMCHNKRKNSFDPTGHAEILCIRKAAKKMKRCFLEDCDMYVTLEPCEMCKSVINECRIKNVYYILSKNKFINNKTNFIKLNIENENNFKVLLSSFFKDKR